MSQLTTFRFMMITTQRPSVGIQSLRPFDGTRSSYPGWNNEAWNYMQFSFDIDPQRLGMLGFFINSEKYLAAIRGPNIVASIFVPRPHPTRPVLPDNANQLLMKTHNLQMMQFYMQLNEEHQEQKALEFVKLTYINAIPADCLSAIKHDVHGLQNLSLLEIHEFMDAARNH